MSPAPTERASDDQVRQDLAEATANVAALKRATAAKALTVAVLAAVEPVAIAAVDVAVASVAGPLGPVVAEVLHREIDRAIEALGLSPGKRSP